jgi:HTH-type transcriptional repressor of NAD biosynthesis genes
MKYSCGLYGGSFNPLHQGHVRCIIEAANQCDRLIIVLSRGVNRKEVDVRVRYRWLYSLTKHIHNVQIFVISDDATEKSEYTEQCWQPDTDKVKAFAGEPIDAVFCGSDYDENSFWAKCYPEAQMVVFHRSEISSSRIRKNPLAHWDWLPMDVRPHYTKKVLITGGESTGKSTLTINLAHYYNTNYLEEVGRNISERSGTDMLMLPEDFTDILLEHKLREIQTIKQSNRILFEDTDCMVTLFYLRFLEGCDKDKNEELALSIAHLNSYDLILYLEPDTPFIQDGGRSVVIAADREKYSNQIKALYREQGFRFYTISGDYQNRFLQAIALVDKLILGELS